MGGAELNRRTAVGCGVVGVGASVAFAVWIAWLIGTDGRTREWHER